MRDLTNKERITNTIQYLKTCQAARAQGFPVFLKTDPTWLVNMAVNRRAGWPESQFYFSSCSPVEGRYPKQADDCHTSFRQFVARVNTPRLIVRETEIPLRYRGRLKHRIFREEA